MYFPVLSDRRVNMKESEKMNNYLDLAREVKILMIIKVKGYQSMHLEQSSKT